VGTANFQSVLPQLLPFRVPERIQTLASKLFGIGELEKIYHALRAERDEANLLERLLRRLAVTYSTSSADLERVPTSGAAIVTVNHPFGMLDGAVVAAVLTRIRPDVRFLANGILSIVPELRDLIIPVDPIAQRAGAQANSAGLRRVLQHLEAGGLIVVFPAGEVSHFRWRERGIADSDWNPAVARLVAIASRRGVRVPIVPMYVAGANSAAFQAAGMIHAGLRTALLGRELLNKRGRQVELRAGAAIPPEKLLAIPNEREQADYLRWRTYLLGGRESFKPRTSAPMKTKRRTASAEIAPAIPVEMLAAEIAQLEPLQRSGELAVYIASAAEIPHILREIGRLREIAFRAAGEGTGKPLDLDEFDRDYLHLFVWHASKREIAGAYRLAGTDVVPKLYTATLFHYSDEFLHRIGPAVELGRSFVRLEYQRSFGPLLLLWKGIGRY
jgi:putative hemolysin